jgi:hypothetical protein
MRIFTGPSDGSKETSEIGFDGSIPNVEWWDKNSVDDIYHPSSEQNVLSLLLVAPRHFQGLRSRTPYRTDKMGDSFDGRVEVDAPI